MLKIRKIKIKMLNESSLFNEKDKFIQTNLAKINPKTGRFGFLTNNLVMRYLVIFIIHLIKIVFYSFISLLIKKINIFNFI